ncbi:MAG TPA: AraC family transcriptional regulator [Bacteroidales bacterium]|nr:AraC family transcriptional regulator [Bacteroidales bacterium]HOK98680.1 AraC family transcriptional regulator [Bacteroidales bacterium]HPO64923.1 AraC family transcriptional regulator [Bacteroidales bacterium]
MERIREIGAKLHWVMEEEKAYLDPQLNLQALAKKVGISTSMLSHILNVYFNTNFCDFVNRYRVRSVIEKLQDPYYNRFNIVILAYESGFNSKASFHRIFKNFTGKTPTEYKKVLEERLSLIEAAV